MISSDDNRKPAPRKARSLALRLRVLCLFSAASAVFSQGVDIRTQNASAVETRRFKVDTGAASVYAWFENANLGIGTSSPQNLLHVAGKARAENLSLVSVVQNPSLYFNAVYNGGDKYIAADSAYRIWHDLANDVLRIQGAAAGAAGGAATFNEGIVLQPSGNAGIKGTPSTSLHVTTGADAVLATAASGYLILGNPGGVNIVADSNEIMARNNGAAADLHIQAEGGDIFFHNNAAAATKAVVKSDGSVGIGTTSPDAKLHVVGGAIMPPYGSTSAAGILFPTDPGGGGGDSTWIRHYIEAGEDMEFRIGIDNDADDEISFSQAGGERLTIYGGNVGVNYTTPSVMLDVAGTIRAQDVFGVGGQNFIIGDDTFLTDVDQAGTLGIYSTGGVPGSLQAGLTGTAALKLGSGTTLIGTSNRAGMVVADNVILTNNAAGGTPRLRTTGGNQIWFNWDGANFRSNVDVTNIKSFVIDHPTEPDRRLVHACIEGPENAVFYRGAGRLEGGLAVVVLPGYFEALTREVGRTVLLTSEFDDDGGPVSALAASEVRAGRFLVRAVDDRNPAQRFSWEVKAVRKDAPPLWVEPRKNEIEVRGDGPYKSYALQRRGFSLYPE